MQCNDGDSEGNLRAQGRIRLGILKSIRGWGCFRHDNSISDRGEKAPGKIAGGRRHEQEIHVIETQLSHPLVERARRTAQWDQSEYSTSRLAHENILILELVPKDVRLRTPKSTEDLGSAISPVFNASTTARIAANSTGSNAIAGIECTEGFICQKLISDWNGYIIEWLFYSVETLDDSSELASSATT